MDAQAFNLYTRGAIQLVLLLAKLEKEKGKAQAVTYRGLANLANVPEATAMRWVREARNAAPALVVVVKAGAGGKTADGQPARVAYKLSDAGRKVAE